MCVNFVIFLAVAGDLYYFSYSLWKWLWEKKNVIVNVWCVWKSVKAWWKNWTQFDPLIGSGPEQACEVSVVNGKDVSQSTTPFTYTLLMTPLITEITPKRGSTAGGTRLRVLGSGFRYCLHKHIHQLGFPDFSLCICFLVCQDSAWI